MQTAAQVEQYPVPPIQPAGRRSNGMIKASFIIGICLLCLGMFNSLFLTTYINSLHVRGIWSPQAYALYLGIISFVVFVIPGILGLILGILGFRRMIKGLPPYDYFKAVTGITLCFMYASNLVFQLFSVLSNALLWPILTR